MPDRKKNLDSIPISDEPEVPSKDETTEEPDFDALGARRLRGLLHTCRAKGGRCRRLEAAADLLDPRAPEPDDPKQTVPAACPRVAMRDTPAKNHDRAGDTVAHPADDDLADAGEFDALDPDDED